MGRIIFICGKICSGKSYYTKNLAKKLNAIVLNVDEIDVWVNNTRN
jgi:tRNA delta(2)-isopentenylpyrophosphate transferase